MPKVSIYLPEELYRRARERGLAFSALTRAALEQALDRDTNGAWVRAVTARESRFDGVINTAELLDEVRDGFGA